MGYPVEERFGETRVPVPVRANVFLLVLVCLLVLSCLLHSVCGGEFTQLLLGEGMGTGSREAAEVVARICV
jgi:hypothetical protein